MPDFYNKKQGAVLGATIDKHMYVMINKKFDDKVRLSYSKTENVETVSDITHSLIRETLQYFGIKKGIEIITMADIPSHGSGLGSSSSTIVGTITALSNFLGKKITPDKIAKIACSIEIDKLGNPIGKQDQYFASFGGLNCIRFNSNESVRIEPLKLKTKIVRELEDSLLCFYTGINRKSSQVLNDQKTKMSQKFDILEEMRKQVDVGGKCLTKGDLIRFGEMLNEGWELKKKLSGRITNEVIDRHYQKALEAGALGGKIAGAGGGGFLLFYCEKNKQAKVRNALHSLKEIKINFEFSGSKLIYNDNQK